MQALESLRNKHRYGVDADKNIIIYKWNGDVFVRLFELSELGNVQILVDYEGYQKVETLEDEININEDYETCLIYYCRAKSYLDEGNIEMHNYYINLYTTTLRKKNITRRNVKAEPSEYSLL